MLVCFVGFCLFVVGDCVGVWWIAYFVVDFDLVLSWFVGATVSCCFCW